MQVANTGASSGDDFIPAPDAANGATPAATNASTLNTSGDLAPIAVEHGLGTTALILALAALLALGGLLLIVRGVIRKSLIASRATIDSANAAAWTWYLSLLLFGALVIAGIAGGLFGYSYYIGLTVAVLVIGVVISMMMTSRARRTA
ncbi:MAG: hypothetical protein JO013_06925 [Alphaproteobacteria bacterium]|nr:hypothetical protein [Alphaproteobacteria bacterium]